MTSDALPTTASAASLTTTPLRPFGLLVQGPPGTRVDAVPPELIAELADRHRVVVLRGLVPLDRQELVDYGARFGEILRWDFGPVLDLVVHEEPKNYLFTGGDVPFHWDGAFAAAAPAYFMFQCHRSNTGGGGETVFCDTTRVYGDATDAERALWDTVTITYTTDKIAHYGGRCTHRLVAEHPRLRVPVLRFAEPLDPDTYLNPLFLQVEGVPERDAPGFVAELSRRVHQPGYCYAHDWRAGDFVVADNDALIHGRNAYTGDTSRFLQRIQILPSTDASAPRAGEE